MQACDLVGALVANVPPPLTPTNHLSTSLGTFSGFPVPWLWQPEVDSPGPLFPLGSVHLFSHTPHKPRKSGSCGSFTHWSRLHICPHSPSSSCYAHHPGHGQPSVCVHMCTGRLLPQTQAMRVQISRAGHPKLVSEGFAQKGQTHLRVHSW